MIGVLLLSHGRLAEGVYDAVKLIAGVSEGLDYLGLMPGMTVEFFTESIRKKVKGLDHGEGVLLITDIIGGTPFNTSCFIKKTEYVEVLSGLNLGMALTAVIEKDDATNMLEFVDAVKQAGVNSIKHFEI